MRLQMIALLLMFVQNGVGVSGLRFTEKMGQARDQVHQVEEDRVSVKQVPIVRLEYLIVPLWVTVMDLLYHLMKQI